MLSMSSLPYSAHAFTNWLKSLLLHSEKPLEAARTSDVSYTSLTHTLHSYLLQEILLLFLLLFCEWLGGVNFLLFLALSLLRIG